MGGLSRLAVRVLALIVSLSLACPGRGRHFHEWMDRVPLTKLDEKSKLSGQNVDPRGEARIHKRGYTEVSSVSQSDDELVFEMSWEVVEPDGSRFEGRLTKETLNMIKSANMRNGRRRRRMQSKGSEDVQIVNDPSFLNATSRFIFGRDDRRDIRCGDEDVYPYSAVGRLSANLDSAGGGGCSGILIGPRHVLTAAHCVHGGRGGDWISSRVKFRPQQNCHARHAPLGTYSWARLTAPFGWIRQSNILSDYALMTLSSRVKVYASFGYDDGVRPGRGIYINGYPMEDKLDFDMWASFGTVRTARRDYISSSTIDTVEGNSGSGMLVISRRAWVTIGVLSAGVVARCRPGIPCDAANIIARINAYRFAQLCGWMNAGIC